MEEATEETRTHIVKGKRTKRQRVQSPIPFGLATDLSTRKDGGENCFADDNGRVINSNDWLLPITTNADQFEDTQQLLEEENQRQDDEEDMANCLILLAQAGGYCHNLSKQDHCNIPHVKTQDNFKFNSRKFLETGTTISGKVAGCYVYECKTCNKTFPSFQALGGHRASHKKPKVLFNDEKKHLATPTLSFNEEDGHNRNISSLSLQLSNNINFNNNRGGYGKHSMINTKKGKMHECATCGAKFNSGQALGGHMRRHRGAIPVGVDTSTNLSLTPSPPPPTEVMEFEESKRGSDELSLDLDLNLPAPEDNRLISVPSKEQNEPEQQQQQLPIVFSGPTLVDCHY